MFLNYFLTIALLLSTFFALFSASHAEAGNALIVGASAAVSFTLELLGAVCLWSAVMELLERSGAVKALTRLLAPLLRRLFPLSSRDGGIMAAISENVSANLLGLGNAATPAGIRAAPRHRASRRTRQRRALQAGRAEHGIDTAHPIDDSRGARRKRRGLRFRYHARRMVQFRRVRRGRAGNGEAARARMAMNTLLDLTAPLIVTAACVLALYKGVDIFAAMTDGAKKGLRVMADILPALLVLFPVIYLLRASGLPELLERLLAPVFKALGIPVETSLLMLLRPVSGSTALSVSAELIARYGADSLVGRTAAVMIGSSETTLYVVAVYFTAAGVKDSRWGDPRGAVRRSRVLPVLGVDMQNSLGLKIMC